MIVDILISQLDYWCQNYDYVALGGMVKIKTNILDRWLNNIFIKYPNINFHGCGVTDIKLVTTNPWYSVDTTTYLVGSEFGEVILISNKTIKRIKKNDIKLINNWQELKNFLHQIDKNIIDFQQNSYIKDVFNITQIIKLQEYKMHDKLKQLTLF